MNIITLKLILIYVFITITSCTIVEYTFWVNEWGGVDVTCAPPYVIVASPQYIDTSVSCTSIIITVAQTTVYANLSVSVDPSAKTITTFLYPNDMCIGAALLARAGENGTCVLLEVEPLAYIALYKDSLSTTTAIGSTTNGNQTVTTLTGGSSSGRGTASPASSTSSTSSTITDGSTSTTGAGVLLAPLSSAPLVIILAPIVAYFFLY